jgi:hypothetical protein
MAKKLDFNDTHWDEKYGTGSEVDQGPATKGQPDHHEPAIRGRSHIGGAGDNEARQHTADWIGDHNADDQSLRGARSLDHLLAAAQPKDPYEHSYQGSAHDAHGVDKLEDDELEADLPRRRGRR